MAATRRSPARRSSYTPVAFERAQMAATVALLASPGTTPVILMSKYAVKSPK